MNRTSWPVACFLFICLLAGQWLFSVNIANAAPPADGPLYHVVKRGETLFYIGRLYGTDPWLIAELNGIWSPSEIYVGQRLFIPNGGYYPPYPCYKYQPPPPPPCHYYPPYEGYAPGWYHYRYPAYTYDAYYSYYPGQTGGYWPPYYYDP